MTIVFNIMSSGKDWGDLLEALGGVSHVLSFADVDETLRCQMG